MSALSPGTRLGRYTILRELGRGGMGEVWLAADSGLEREVALKVLPPALAERREVRERFEREARAAAALAHPGIVTLHSIEEADGLHFITMELVSGETLARLLPERGFPLPRLLEIALKLADAVAAAHAAGI